MAPQPTRPHQIPKKKKKKAEMAIFVGIFHDRALRQERRFRDRFDPLALSDQELIAHYRFPRHELINLIEEMDPFLRRTRRSQAIPTHTSVDDAKDVGQRLLSACHWRLPVSTHKYIVKYTLVVNMLDLYQSP